MFAGVIVNKNAEALNRIFYYLVPIDFDVHLGDLVQVSFGVQKLEAIVIELVEDVDFDKAKIKPLLKRISPVPLFGKDLIELSEYIANYYATSRALVLQAMLPAGMHLTGKMPKANLVKMVRLLDGNVSLRGEKQRLAVDYLSAKKQVSAKELEDEMGVSAAVLKGLASKGVVEIFTQTFWGDDEQEFENTEVTLSQRQCEVLSEIEGNFHGENKTVLLHGVTGSGKTEIYLQLAKAQQNLGKQVIILVPEIALTPQTVGVFQNRLGAKVAVLHSGLTGAERRLAWLGIAEGKFDIVIGARSAIFAPCQNLGLIIIDEEHEGSYKQDNNPRFHTKVVAAKRGELTGASLVLGSATPELESYYKALSGEYLLCEMPERIGNRPLAEIQLVDMRDEFKKGNNSIFSLVLQKKMVENFKAGKQSLLFLNRRGYDSFVSCRHCGFVVECPHCSVALANHQGDGVMKCHYCDHTEAVPTKCPSCGSVAIRFFGAGTQKIVEAVKKLLPTARVARIDRDAIKERGMYEQIYNAVKAGKVDVLVGTQMIAKGLDFPNVTLVGVVAADTSLNLPDFRANERTYQLLTQVAGRAGRHQHGEVVVQTYTPDSEVLQAVVRQNYEEFYEREVFMREMVSYPPFSKIIRVVVTSESLPLAEKVARDFAYYLGQMQLFQNAVDEVSYFGPKPCPKEKIKDKYRQQIMIKSENLDLSRKLVKDALNHLKFTEDVQVFVDIEPLNMV